MNIPILVAMFKFQKCRILLLNCYQQNDKQIPTGDIEIKGQSDLTRNDGPWSGLEQNFLSNDSNNL